MLEYNDDIVNEIKKSEGFASKPYKDTTKMAIGYGQNDFDPKIKSVTEKQADKMLRSHMDKLSKEINAELKVSDFTPGQVKTIYDFAYNMGVPKMKKHGLFKKLNDGDLEGFGNAIKKFTKATYYKTDRFGRELKDRRGNPIPVLKEVPALVKRRDERLKWWNEGTPKTQSNNSLDFDFNSFENEFEKSLPEQERNRLQGASTALQAVAPEQLKGDVAPELDFDAFESQFNSADPNTPTRNMRGQISQAARGGDETRVLAEEEAFRLHKQYGVPLEEAKQKLRGQSFDDIISGIDIDNVTQTNPRTAEFITNPDNYVMYRQDPETMKKLDEGVSYFSEFGTAAMRSFRDSVPETAYIMAEVNGMMSREDMIRELQTIQKRKNSDEALSYDADIAEVNRVTESSKKKLAKGLQGIEDFYDLENNPSTNFKQLVQQYKDGIESGIMTAESVYDLMKAYITHPGASGIMLGKSAAGMAIPIAAGVVGTKAGIWAGAPMGPKGSLVLGTVGGIGSTFVSSAVMSYSSYISQEMEKYRQKDGTIDYNAFFSKENYPVIKDAAFRYAVAQGALSSIQIKLLGQFFGRTVGAETAKAVAKEAVKTPVKSILVSSLGKVKTAATGVAKEAVSQGASEFAEEAIPSYIARRARTDLGELTVEDYADNFINSVSEGYLGAKAGSVIGPVAAAFKYPERFKQKKKEEKAKAASERVKERTDKKAADTQSTIKTESELRSKVASVVNTVEEATNSIRSFEQSQEIRETLKNSKTKNKYPEKTREFINSILNPKPEVKPAETVVPEDIGKVDDAIAVKEFDDEVVGKNPYVSISAEDLADILLMQGKSPDKVVKLMGTNIYADYGKAKENRGDIEIPIADWYMATEEHPELEVAARYNGAKFSPLEAESVLNQFGDNPFTMFSEGEMDGDVPPPIPGTGTPPSSGEVRIEPPSEKPSIHASGDVSIATADADPKTQDTQFIEDGPTPGPYDKETNLKPVSVFGRFKNAGEREVHKKIHQQLSLALAETNMDDAEIRIAADIQFNRVRYRAQVLGKDIRDIKDRFTFKKMSADEAKLRPNSVAFADPLPNNSYFDFRVVFRRDSKINTVMHEFGHTWLYEMSEDWELMHSIPEESLTPEQKDYKEAMDTLNGIFQEKGFLPANETIASINNVEWFSLPESHPKRIEEIKKRKLIHETFAQSAEKFFLEGDFENTKMKRVLEVFRKFFTRMAEFVGRAYERQGIFPLQISPEVQRVFKAILDLNQKQEEILYPMLSEPTFDSKILGARAGAHMEAVKAAHDHTIGKFYNEAFRQKLSEREKEIKKMQAFAEKTAAERVDSLPSMQMLRDFYSAAEDFRNGNAESSPTISHESFVRDLFDGNEAAAMEYKKQISSLFVAGKKKGGADAREIMANYNIGSKKAMVDAMVEASARDRLIDEEANAIYEKMLPTLKTNEELHDLAVEAVQNKSKEKYLRLEMEFLMDMARPQFKQMMGTVAAPAGDIAKKISPEFIEGAADKIVRDTRVKALRPMTFINRSDRFGRSASKKFQAGDFIGAFEDKQMQAVYFEAFKRSEKQRKILAKTRKQVERLTRRSLKTLSKSYDEDVVTYLRGVIQMIRMNQVQAIPHLNAENFHNSYIIADHQVESINATLDSFKSLMMGKYVGDPTVEAWLELSNFQNQVMSLADGTLSVQRDLKKVKLLESVTEGAKQIITGQSDTSGIGNDNTGAAMLADAYEKIVQQAGLNKYLQSVLYIRSIFASMFKSDADFVKSELGKQYYETVDASSTFDNAFSEEMASIEKMVRKVIRQDKGLAKVYGPLLRAAPIDKFKKTPIVSEHLGVTFEDKSEIIMLMLYMGSESGRIKVLSGGYKGQKLGRLDVMAQIDKNGEANIVEVQAAIDALIDEGVITQADLDFVQAIFDTFAKYHEDVKSAIKYTDGYTPGTIEAKSFETKLGTIKGGYIPLASDGNYLSDREKRDDVLNLDADSKYIMDLYPMQNTSMAKSRTSDQYNLNFNLSRITYDLQNHMKVALMRKTLHDTGKFLSHPMIKETISKHRKDIYSQIIRPWFERTALQRYSAAGVPFFDGVFNILRRGTYMKAFLFNFKSMAKQYLGLVPVTKEVGALRVAHQMLKNLHSPSGYRAARDRVSSMSPSMKNRLARHYSNLHRDLDELSKSGGWIADTKNWANRMSSLLIQAAQGTVDVVVFEAAYDKALDLGLKGQDATNYAYDVVVKTQSSTNIAEAPRAFFGTGTEKLFVQFATYNVAAFNQYYMAYSRNRDSKWGAGWALITTSAMVSMLPLLLESALFSMLPEMLGMGDDEDEKKKKKDKSVTDEVLTRSALGMMSHTAPIVGDIAGRVMFGENRVRPFPAAAVFDDAMTVRRAIDKKGYGVDMTDKEFRTMMDFGTTWLNLPLNIVNKTMDLGDTIMPDSRQEKARAKMKRKAQLKRARLLKKREDNRR